MNLNNLNFAFHNIEPHTIPTHCRKGNEKCVITR